MPNTDLNAAPEFGELPRLRWHASFAAVVKDRGCGEAGTLSVNPRGADGTARAMHKPWDVAPALPVGDADVGRIYHAVGLALSRWEILEVALSYLYGTILDTKTSAAVTAYRSVTPEQFRLRLIQDALEGRQAAMPRPLHAEIVAFLDNEIVPLADRRNEIAHGTAVLVKGGVGGQYLVSPGSTARKLLWRRVPIASDVFPFRRLAFAYTASQIAAYGERFWEGSRRCFQFGNRLVEAREALSPYRSGDGRTARAGTREARASGLRRFHKAATSVRLRPRRQLGAYLQHRPAPFSAAAVSVSDQFDGPI